MNLQQTERVQIMSIISINYTIDTTTCGENSDDENQRYANAVESTLANNFPGSEIFVELSNTAVSVYGRCTITTEIVDQRWEDVDMDLVTDDLEEIDSASERVSEIASDVWNNANY